MPESIINISRVNTQVDRGPVVFGDVVYAPGGVCGPRIQNDYQLVVIHRGKLDLKLDSRKIHVPAGHAILLSPGHREYFQFARDTETNHGWCAVREKTVPVAMRRVFNALRDPAPFGAHLAALLDLGNTALTGVRPGSHAENDYFHGIGLALLSGFALAAQSDRSVQTPCDEARARLDAFISREYGRPLSLADLALAAGVSRQHLMKLFRERGLPTPTEYLYEKRLRVAADLLSQTGIPIGEIAFRCGFANAFHFSRKFRLAYGESPRAWRDRAWAGAV